MKPSKTFAMIAVGLFLAIGGVLGMGMMEAPESRAQAETGAER